MIEEDVRFDRYRFPDRAGEMQAQGDLQGLRDELSRRYNRYHSALAEEFERVGGRPDPEEYRGRLADYEEACNYLTELLRVEVTLRVLRHFRATGRRSSATDTFAGRPLVDEMHRLVSVDGAGDDVRAQRRGSRQALRWQPPAPTDF